MTDTETDCPRCSRAIDVSDLCGCDQELGPYCEVCCRRFHDPEVGL